MQVTAVSTVSDYPTYRSQFVFGAVLALVFCLGCIFGGALVYRAWTLSSAPRWLMYSAWGYISFTILPITAGALLTRLCSGLTARGWAWSSVRVLLLGVAGLFAGVVLL